MVEVQLLGQRVHDFRILRARLVHVDVGRTRPVGPDAADRSDRVPAEAERRPCFAGCRIRRSDADDVVEVAAVDEFVRERGVHLAVQVVLLAGDSARAIDS